MSDCAVGSYRRTLIVIKEGKGRDVHGIRVSISVYYALFWGDNVYERVCVCLDRGTS